MRRISKSDVGRHPGSSTAEREIIMRLSVKQSLTGLLVMGVLALGASGLLQEFNQAGVLTASDVHVAHSSIRFFAEPGNV